MTSMMPEPQTPVTPVRAVAASESRIVRPELAADHLVARLERRRVDAHALDRAGRGALAAGDLRALEGGARRARAGEQALAVAEHDFRIRADVDEERDLVALVGPLGEDHAGAVGADVARDAGQDVDARVGVHGDPERGRRQRQRLVDRERERRAAELDRIDAEHEVMHDRVADERKLEDVGRLDPGLAREFGGERRERIADRLGHLHRAARIHHRVGDAAHQVLAEADLRVHHARGGGEFAALEVAQVRGDRGGTDVHRHAESLVVKAGPQRDDLRLAVHGGRDFPRALAQERLQPAEEGRIAGKVLESPLALERLEQAPQVAGGILHVRFFHLDVMQANDRVQLDLARIRVLAHDLAVNLAARAARPRRRRARRATGRTRRWPAASPRRFA